MLRPCVACSDINMTLANTNYFQDGTFDITFVSVIQVCYRFPFHSGENGRKFNFPWIPKPSSESF